MSRDKIEGWFTTRGRLGDRTLASQLEGLDRLLAMDLKGKTVLDLGCAEGLISMRLADMGATTQGVEIVDGHVKVANKIKGARRCKFKVGDLNEWKPWRHYDIVLMLAVLHKLKDPTAAAQRFAAAANDLVVIRLPPYGFTIVDERSGNEPHDIRFAMESVGWRLDEESRGPFNEAVGYFVKA